MVESCFSLQLSLAKQAVFLKVTVFLRGYTTNNWSIWSYKDPCHWLRVAISERLFQPWTHCGIGWGPLHRCILLLQRDIPSLSLCNPASCTSLQVLFLSILQNKPPVFKHVCLEPNYKRRKRKYGRHTSVFLMPWLEAALITFIHIAIARTSVLTTCVCNITEKYTTSWSIHEREGK